MVGEDFTPPIDPKESDAYNPEESTFTTRAIEFLRVKLSYILLVSFIILSALIYYDAINHFLSHKFELAPILHVVDRVLIAFTVGTLGLRVFYNLQTKGLGNSTGFVDSLMIKMIILTLSVFFLSFVLSFLSSPDIRTSISSELISLNILIVGLAISVVVASLSYFLSTADIDKKKNRLFRRICG